MTLEEFQRMLNVSPEYPKPVRICAYYTGMHKKEVLGLTWDRVDLKGGFIRLKEARHQDGQAAQYPLLRDERL